MKAPEIELVNRYIYFYELIASIDTHIVEERVLDLSLLEGIEDSDKGAL